MFNIESVFDWKTALLVHGCRVALHTEFPTNISLKKIHLYEHSNEKIDQPIPDDLLLPHQTIVRIRYRSNSPFILESAAIGYRIRNEKNSEYIPVELIDRPGFSELKVSELPIPSICSFLGTDLLGIIPSNYCFYFQTKKQCRFCEILPTFKNKVEFPKTFKSLDVIEKSILTALQNEERLRFVAITTGNIHSYDATIDYFIQIGERLQKALIFQKAEQVLATLMPPEDLSKISLLREKGFTKIYFPLEIFDPGHFRIVCPGKDDFGYERILKALEIAIEVFGVGNVYTNFVYGIQSLNSSLSPTSYHPERENNLSLQAVKELLARKVIPAFTLYHYGGYNSIGKIELDLDATNSFFREWGTLVCNSGIVPIRQETVLFSPLSLSNTLFNDGFRLANKREKKLWI
ncbi:MAG: radical SAM protein [Candidatus Rhabdochlamydia sp.]|mgnify:CR=1 FL=1